MSTPAREPLLQPIARPQSLQTLDASRVTVEITKHPKQMPPLSDLKFGRHTTDHMLLARWDTHSGWQDPEIRPYKDINLDPTASVLHYGLECYEGLKAFRDAQGEVQLFRPDKNMSRLSRSAQRIALPAVDGTQLLALIRRLVILDQRFIPRERGYSLYIRPCVIGTNSGLGLSPPTSALLFVIASPVGPYFEKGFKAVSLATVSDMQAIRAWPGGVGDMKLGGNYAPCILPESNARLRGHQQILWLLGGEGFVTEVGAMNFFVVIRDRDARKLELLTAPLDGTILDGITRDSVLALARERLDPDEWTVSERRYTMGELHQAAQADNLMEAFGTGTAAVITPVRNIEWRGMVVSCGLNDGEEAGSLTKMMKTWIEDIQYGRVEHHWSTRVA